MAMLMKIAACILALVLIAQAYPNRRSRGWESGASSQGTSWGDNTAINTKSRVNNNWYGSQAQSSGSASAAGRGNTVVHLISDAGVNGYGGRGRAGAGAFGDKASSSAGVTGSEVSRYDVAVGSSGAAGSVSTSGFGGARSNAGAEDNFGGVNAGGRGQGQGDLVISRSQSEAGLLNGRQSGKASGYSATRGQGSSFTEAGASIRRGSY